LQRLLNVFLIYLNSQGDNMTRKEQIIEAGLNCAANGGLTAVTLSGVARKIKCSHGTISFHFGSLAGLHNAVKTEAIKRKDKRVLPWLRAAGEKV